MKKEPDLVAQIFRFNFESPSHVDLMIKLLQTTSARILDRRAVCFYPETKLLSEERLFLPTGKYYHEPELQTQFLI